MKKILTVLIALSLVITVFSSLTVSAEEIALNSAGKGWKAYRSNPLFIDDTNDSYEFHWKTDANKKTWTWPVLRTDGFDEGTIEIEVSPSANVGIIFGGCGIKEYVGESYEYILGSTSEKRGSLGRTDKDIRFYWAAVVWKDDIPTFKLIVDDGADTAFKETFSLPLEDIDNNSDIIITVSFNQSGKCFISVNKEKVYSSDTIELFGDQYGIAVCEASYPSAEGLERIGYLKSFAIRAFEDPSNIANEGDELPGQPSVNNDSAVPAGTDNENTTSSFVAFILWIIIAIEITVCAILSIILVKTKKTKYKGDN